MSAPIPMILICPRCGMKHIDAPEPATGWENPPHKSHLCAMCGTIWRPADVPTTGVAEITTHGSKDDWDPSSMMAVTALVEAVARALYEEQTRADTVRAPPWERVPGIHYLYHLMAKAAIVTTQKIL